MRHFHHCIRSNNYLSYCRFHCSETYSYSRFHCSETYSYSRFHCSETYSHSRFHCSETRFIFITGYAAVTTLVIPASTEVKHASFYHCIRSSNYLSYSRFHCSETYIYSRFHCVETRVILINGYIEGTPPNIPASI